MAYLNQQYDLEAINIIKGIAYSQLIVDEIKTKLFNTPDFDAEEIFNKIDVKGIKKIFPSDIAEFLSVHRIAASQRECQYFISLNNNHQTYISLDYFKKFICGNRQVLMGRSYQRPVETGDLLVKNYCERQTAKIFEKQLQFYRSIETLRQEFVKNYGYNFQNLFNKIDIQKKGYLDERAFINFIHRYKNKVEFSPEQFEAMCKRITSQQNSLRINYQDFMKLFSPFEPTHFPIFRKQNNLKEALDYILKEVNNLDIDMRDIQIDPQIIKNQEKAFAKTNMSIRKVFDPYKNNQQGGTAKYFYDKDYFNELKQYKVTYFDPNKNYKFKFQEDIKGPQYHDHFFESYYTYLYERNKSQYFYNKFGKRYTFENNIQTRTDSKRKSIS